jgi:oligopeptide transport system permease protein
VRNLPAIFIISIAIISLAYALGLSFSDYKYNAMDIDTILQPPSLLHLFGTDPLGRDLLVRMIHGSQMSLSVAFLTALMALIIGTVLGIAGYVGGWIDELIMKLIDFIYSLPDLLVLSIIALFVSRSTTGIVIGLAFINWMDLARLVRVEIMKLKAEEFIEASRSLGLGHISIITQHLLPNTLPSIIVALSFTIPRAILSESTLSFIGLGISPPDTSWGTLAGDAWQYLRSDPYMIFFPALMIFLTVFCFNYLGDQLRDHYSAKKIGEHLLAH